MVVNKFTLTQQHHRCYLSVPNTHITRTSNRFLQEMMLSTKCCRLPELSILHICRQMAFPPDGGPWGVFLACYLQETFNGLSGLTFLSMLKMDNICANLMVHYLPMRLGFCFIHVSCPWTLSLPGSLLEISEAFLTVTSVIPHVPLFQHEETGECDHLYSICLTLLLPWSTKKTEAWRLHCFISML